MTKDKAPKSQNDENDEGELFATDEEKEALRKTITKAEEDGIDLSRFLVPDPEWLRRRRKKDNKN